MLLAELPFAARKRSSFMRINDFMTMKNFEKSTNSVFNERPVWYLSFLETKPD